MDEINIDNICRACLTEDCEFQSVFVSDERTGVTICLAEMIMAYSSVTVTFDDGLPPQICLTCAKKVTDTFMFKKQCEASDSRLREKIGKSSSTEPYRIKEELSPLKLELTETLDIVIKPEKHLEGDSYGELSDKIDIHLDLFDQDKKEIFANFESQINESNEPRSEKEFNIFCNNTKQNNAVENIKITEVHSLATTLFTNEPPPLVPLNNVIVNALTVNVHPPEAPIPDVPILKPICDDVPSLIPIKPPTSLDQKYESRQIVLECSICSEKISNITELNHHLSTQHSSTAGSNLICNICRKEFLDKKRLIGHLKAHIIVKPYTCKICKKKYPNPSTFAVHMRTHTGERPYKCEICGKGFIRWAGVDGHMKSHTNITPFKCDICQKGFKVNSNLERHKILHTGEMPFCCSYCGKTFSQSDNLQLHVRSYHTHERPYLCSVCGKGFVSATRLNRHMWVHTGYKPYSCKICHKSYINSVDLKKHERSHNGGLQDYDKPYPCNQCNLRFLHQCRLTKHMKTHEKPYACLDCPKTFSKQNDLTKHVIIKHTDEQILVYKSNENF